MADSNSGISNNAQTEAIPATPTATEAEPANAIQMEAVAVPIQPHPVTPAVTEAEPVNASPMEVVAVQNQPHPVTPAATKAEAANTSHMKIDDLLPEVEDRDVAGRSSPPPPFEGTLDLAQLNIIVEMRKAGLTTLEPADYFKSLPVTTILNDMHKHKSVEEIGAHHLNYDAFGRWVKLIFNRDLAACDFGFASYLPPDPPQYFSINGKNAFCSALNTLQNQASIDTPPKLWLWYPRSNDNNFRPSPRYAPRHVAREPNLLKLAQLATRENHQLAPSHPDKDLSGDLDFSNSPFNYNPLAIPEFGLPDTSGLVGRSKELETQPVTAEPAAPTPAPQDISPPARYSNTHNARNILPAGPAGPNGDNGGENVSDSGYDSDYEQLFLHENLAPELIMEKARDMGIPVGDATPMDIDEELETAMKNTKFPEKVVRLESDSDEDFEAKKLERAEKLGEYMELMMLKVSQGTVIERMSSEEWQETCDFFHFDFSKQKPGYSVSIKYFGRKLLQMQARSVLRALKEEHGPAGSLYVGHVMGIGKSTLIFATQHVQNIFNVIFKDIHRNKGQHMNPQDDNGHHLCPNNEKCLKETGFDCPCAKKSPSHFMRPLHGCTGVLVPVLLLPVIMEEARMCVYGRRHLMAPEDYRLVVENIHGSNIVPGDVQDLIKAQVNITENDEGIPTFNIKARACNSRVILICSSDSWQSKFITPFQQTREWWVKQPKALRPRTGKPFTPPAEKHELTYPTVICSKIARDEFHLQYLETSKTSTAIAATKALCEPYLMPQMPFDNGKGELIKVAGNIKLEFYSGTPINDGPGNLIGPARLMERPCWKYDEELRNWLSDNLGTAKRIAGLNQEWLDYLKGNDDPTMGTEILQSIAPYINRTFIRATSKTRMPDGSRVVSTPLNLQKDIICDHGDNVTRALNALKHTFDQDQAARLQEQLQKHIDRGKGRDTFDGFEKAKKSRPSKYYSERMATNFPGLINLRDENGQPYNLTESHYSKHQPLKRTESKTAGGPEYAPWSEANGTCPFFSNRKSILKGSAKLDAIKKIKIDWQDVKDCKGNPGRQVFSSYFFLGAKFMYWYLTENLEIPEEDVCLIHQALSDSDKQKQMNRWNKGDENGYKPRYLVAMNSTIGTGITLKDVLTITLLEPEYRLSWVLQIFGRHCRQGNENIVTFCYMLLAKGSEIEERILGRNKKKMQIQELQKGKLRAGGSGKAAGEKEVITLD